MFNAWMLELKQMYAKKCMENQYESEVIDLETTTKKSHALMEL